MAEANKNSHRETPIGLLPKDWEVRTIDEISTLVGSGITPRGGRKSYLSEGIPLLRSQNVLMNRIDLRDVAFISEETHRSMARSSIRPGDVLLNITGASIGRVAVVPSSLKDANVNQHVCRIRLCPEVHSPFISLYLSTEMGQGQVLGSQYGTTRQGLNYGQVRQFRVPVPPLPEQKAIAQVLKTVQEAKEATEQVIEATRQLKQSLMKHLFTYGPVPFGQADQVNLKETEIGPVPEHWEVARLGEISAVRGSTSTCKQAQERCAPGKDQRLLFLKVSDLNTPENIPRVQTAATEIHLAEDGLSKIKFVPPGSVVLPKRGAAIATNKKRQTTTPCLLDPNLIGVTPLDCTNADFLFRWFETFDLRGITDETTLPQLNKKDLDPIELPLPPLDEQGRIAGLLDVVEEKMWAESSHLSSLDALLQSLLHHLMTGKVRVKDLKIG